MKIVEFFKHNKQNWKKLGIEELEKDEELIFVKSIMDLDTETRNSKWLRETGKTIRTLQRKITTIRQNDIVSGKCKPLNSKELKGGND